MNSLNLGDSCHYAANNLLPSYFLTRILDIKIYIIVSLSVCFVSVVKVIVTLLEEHRLRLLENKVLRKNLDLSGSK
jgi:hypothetical protein